MFAVQPSDINSLKSGLLHLIAQPYRKKSRSAKSKMELKTYFLGTISLIDTIFNKYKCFKTYLGTTVPLRR